MYDYAKAFRIIRAAFGLKQSELAARMPITASQLSLIEGGHRQPSLRVVNALARELGIPSALVSVLAATDESIKSKPDEEISDLARAVLRLLVAAKSDDQRQLKLER
jgi:transcriptional regulator with XRE-family HTH domain